MTRIHSIARAIEGIFVVLAGAVRAALDAARRPAKAPAGGVQTGSAAARDGESDRANDEPVQPYPDEVHVDGQSIELPQPSSWPMVLALGVTIFFFGLVTRGVLSVAGFIVVAWAVAGWVGEIRHG